MRSLFLLAGLLLATPALAQDAAQRELNALTGAPEGTRCFRSPALAQEMARHYIASGLCPQQLSAVHPAEFMQALEQQQAIDQDFTTDVCQLQLKLMFRAGREWLTKNKGRNCPVVAQEMRRRPFFKEYVLGR